MMKRLYIKKSNLKQRPKKGNSSICRLKDGQHINADYNASLNIGARYYIEQILREEKISFKKGNELYGTPGNRSYNTLLMLLESQKLLKQY